MCGFAGYFAVPGATATEHTEAVARMADAIRHRGPDDHGTWCDPAAGITLGFRRLSIIDLSERGHQPMRSASGRYTMVFNGEVYNFAELREQLAQRGARFQGHSDSEVILAACEAWGVERALPRLVGMFAVAVWDATERCLHLTRDRFGKKPLYVATARGVVSFGSEIKALLAGPGFDRQVDVASVAAFLRLLYIPAPWTIFRDVRKLEPGHLLTVRDPSGPLEPSRPYWSLAQVIAEASADPFVGSDEEGIAEADRLLGTAVGQRMVSDVPLGAFLSGGIDSSLVVAMMQERADRPVRTFSIGFDEADYDESAHAARVAAHLGTDHTPISLTGADALALVPEVATWFDEPLADPSQLPTFLICRESRRHVTVAVSGDGGDELFGGYNRYRHGNRLLRLGRRLGRFGTMAARAGSWALAGVPRSRGHRESLHKAVEAFRAGPSGAAMYRSLVSAGFQRSGELVPEALERPTAIDRAFAPDLPLGSMERLLFADQLEYLPDDLLAKVDRTSMAVSLEVRVPLLDHRVAEFSWRLPRRFKIRDGQSKWLLRQLLYRRVPQTLVERPKMGFSVPIDRWLRGPLRPWAEDLLAPASLGRVPMLDAARARGAWDAFRRGDGRIGGMAVWALVNLVAWFRRWA